MTDHSGKIFPLPTPETAPYWEACRAHELRLQCCDSCGQHQFYPRSLCSSCMSDQLQWVAVAGTGEVVSFTIVRRAVSEAYSPEVPYVVALVQLAEGPTMMSNVVECDPESVVVGMPVGVLFEDWSDEISIPKFRPIVTGGES
jgi:uncharacterized OB-fold protein